MIKAEVHSDDYIAQTDFDATLWFEQANPTEIFELAKCGWGGDYPADAVARYMAVTSVDVGRVFVYVDSIQNDWAKKDVCGFECHVDRDDAKKWLFHNRPDLYKEIDKIE